jgi:hypothetical protein
MTSVEELQKKTDALKAKIETTLLDKIASTAATINKSKSNFQKTQQNISNQNNSSFSSIFPNHSNGYYFPNTNQRKSNWNAPFPFPIPPRLTIEKRKLKLNVTKNTSRKWIRSSLDFKNQGSNKLVRRIIAGLFYIELLNLFALFI